MVSPATGFLYAVPRGELLAIRNPYRNVWTTAQQQAGVTFRLARRVWAHLTGEWRQAALDELAGLVAGVDAESGRRAR